MKCFSLFFSVLLFSVIQAQAPETYTVKPGEKIYDAIPLKQVYYYPEFVLGTVIFRDDRLVSGRLNYNTLIGAVQFIDAKGDTLSLADEQTIKYVVITKDSFCYDNGYIQLLAQRPSVKLGRRIYFKEFEQKPGSYGLSSGTTSAVNLTAILEKRSYSLNIDQELVLVKRTDYFFGNTNEFLPAEKKNVLKLFSKQKKEIIGYLNNTPVNFSKEEDLVKLASFLQGL